MKYVQKWVKIKKKTIFLFRKELSSISLPEEWYKGIMEFSAEESSQGNLMIAWIGGTASQVADTLPDDQVYLADMKSG
jgi:hypothetical protein